MKTEIRRIHHNNAQRLTIAGESSDDRRQIQSFVESLNRGPIDKKDVGKNPVFDLPLRVESIGFDGEGNIETIAIEGPLCS